MIGDGGFRVPRLGMHRRFDGRTGQVSNDNQAGRRARNTRQRTAAVEYERRRSGTVNRNFGQAENRIDTYTFNGDLTFD